MKSSPVVWAALAAWLHSTRIGGRCLVLPLSRVLNEDQPVVRGCAGCLATRIDSSCLDFHGPEQVKACGMGLEGCPDGSLAQGHRCRVCLQLPCGAGLSAGAWPPALQRRQPLRRLHTLLGAA